MDLGCQKTAPQTDTIIIMATVTQSTCRHHPAPSSRLSNPARLSQSHSTLHNWGGTLPGVATDLIGAGEMPRMISSELHTSLPCQMHYPYTGH